MSKNIVLLSDGTGNSAGKLTKTNVWRLYQSLDLSLPDPVLPTHPQQIAYYDDGVGTSSFKPLAIIGGAFGWGLKRNVIDLYTFLCRNYQPGDRIYGFGFSRGAFTIRVLTGVVNSQGLVQADSQVELRRLATEAFRVYRISYRRSFLLKPLRSARDIVVHVKNRIRKKQSYQRGQNPQKPSMTFLGLWDSVAAYGLPLEELTRAWDWIFPLSTPDRNICANVERACHALALDDERNSFHPVLWNEEHLDSQAKSIADERLSQVWFTGMHSNVGGGYPDDALAHVSLDWIMGEAHRAGLRFKAGEREKVEATADACGKLYDSRHGLGGTYRYLPRKLTTLTNDDRDEKNKVIVKRPKIHESVFTRIQRGIDGYAPVVLPPRYAVVTTEGKIINLGTAHTAEKPYFVEHHTQAESRANRQEAIWNLIWWKRVAYFTSVFVALALLAFPVYRPATRGHESPFSSLSWIVSAVGVFLPAFANPWLEAYHSHPGTFALLALLLSALIHKGSQLQARISDEMRAIWRPIAQHPGVCEQPVAAVPGDFVYRLRSSPLYQHIFYLIKWHLAPLVVGGFAALVIAQGGGHGLFAMASSLGFVCTPSDFHQGTRGILEHGTFHADDLCWASGVEVEQGKRYRLTMSIDEHTEWRDDSLKTGIGGFGAKVMKPAMYFGLLLRRHVSERWFKPIARIGSQGSDEYPLDPVDRSIPNEKTKTLIAEITARRSGELFLFVNDAVLPVPRAWQVFYRNNSGTATVTLQPVVESTR